MGANPIWFVGAKVVPGDTILAVWLNCSLVPLTLYTESYHRKGGKAETGCGETRRGGPGEGRFCLHTERIGDGEGGGGWWWLSSSGRSGQTA